MTLPVFPSLQAVGNGGKTKQEAKANAIIAFLAHMEKRKQVGLFVPYVVKIDLCERKLVSNTEQRVVSFSLSVSYV